MDTAASAAAVRNRATRGCTACHIDKDRVAATRDEAFEHERNRGVECSELSVPLRVLGSRREQDDTRNIDACVRRDGFDHCEKCCELTNHVLRRDLGACISVLEDVVRTDVQQNCISFLRKFAPLIHDLDETCGVVATCLS